MAMITKGVITIVTVLGSQNAWLGTLEALFTYPNTGSDGTFVILETLHNGFLGPAKVLGHSELGISLVSIM